MTHVQQTPSPAAARPPSPVAVIGAGPVGLAAAAHLVQRGLPVIVLEAGASVAAHLASYSHVRLFSPWRYNIDRAARELLLAEGWSAPADEALPTAGDLIDAYLAPLARTSALTPHVHFGSRVLAVSRVGFDKAKTVGRESADFVLQVSSADGLREVRAQAVIDATGTWSQPNPLGGQGLPATGEAAAREHIAYGMPDILGAGRSRYAGRKVLVVGAGHSAAGNLLALARLAEQVPATRLAWAVRGKDLRRLFGGGMNDGLPARGELGTRLRALVDQGRLELHLGFAIGAVEHSPQGVRIKALDPTRSTIREVDEIIGATGARPDLLMTRELRLRHDPWLESTDALAPLIDPNVHSCGTVRPHGHRELAHPEPGYYAIGAKSYGRAPNFLMATGYEQARSVVAALAGDLRAADDVQLELPETGVCSTDLARPAHASETRILAGEIASLEAPDHIPARGRACGEQSCQTAAAPEPMAVSACCR